MEIIDSNENWIYIFKMDAWPQILQVTLLWMDGQIVANSQSFVLWKVTFNTTQSYITLNDHKLNTKLPDSLTTEQLEMQKRIFEAP